MASPYQEFLEKARERFQANQKKKRERAFALTRHGEFKMRQYALSEQKVRSVVRNPRRIEEGVANNTVAVMQPVSPKRDAKGIETWKQEIWVMYQLRKGEAISKSQIPISNRIRNSKSAIQNPMRQKVRIISAWRYPGVSPKRNPIPQDILRELEEESILEEEM